MELAENSVDAPPSRVVGRPFAPGVSGNPDGCPKGLARYVRLRLGYDPAPRVELGAGARSPEAEALGLRRLRRP